MLQGCLELGVEGVYEGGAPVLAGFIGVGVEEDFVGGHGVFFSCPVDSLFECDVCGTEGIVIEGEYGRYKAGSSVTIPYCEGVCSVSQVCAVGLR